MYLIIVGAGPVGSGLIELALQDGHNVVLIEANAKRAQEASQKYDVMVLHADIAQGGILEEAGIEQADALVAATGDDSDNLMAMFLGVEYGVKTLISIVNDQRHRRLFERLGVHVLVDPEKIVAQHLYDRLCQPTLEEVVTLPSGAQVFDITLSPSSPLVGKSLASATAEGLLPTGLLIVSLRRDGEVYTPTGETILAAGDHLTVFSQVALKETQLKVFTG
ncbi:MAG: TrkA family potassium uptake protein [Nitrospinota bacterium]|nr:MAG: TrkA family potassium uptake protein [Nitrospinota bacterium]